MSTNASATVRALEDERDAVLADRNRMRDLWLRQVDANDGARHVIAVQGLKIGELEAEIAALRGRVARGAP